VITVHGLLGVPSAELRIAATAADWVVGGRRHLDALDVAPECRITLGALRQAVDQLADLPEKAQVVVVASGDPLYFGVVRSLRAHGLQTEVVTAPSSIAAAFAAVALPWDDATVVSVHGRPLAAAVNLARALPKVAVFTSAENGIQELAAGLAGLKRWFVLAERLGEPDERVRVLNAAAAAVTQPLEPNVVLILAAPPAELDPDWPGTVAAPARPSRPQVSAAAAVAFARLLPEPGEMLWASGPLGAEVAALAAWAQAAVLHEPSAEASTKEPTPDLMVADASDVLTLLDGRSPRAIVLTGEASVDPPGAYRWNREGIGDHQLTTGVPR